MLNRFTGAAFAGALLFVSASSSGAIAETKLTLVYPFPDFLVYTQKCKELAGTINERGAGKVSIEVLPFNSIKMFQQPPAVRRGRVDLACTPSAFFARALPENEAVSTSNSSAAKVRANGGTAMLDGLSRKHYNVTYLGWTTSGAQFRIYMRDAPKWTSSGLLDLSGVKLRDNPIYGAFFRALKGSTHNLPATDVYGALEKGVVNASAWATVGLPGLKWDKFLRHAVTPEFYQTDVGWIMNLDSWNKLDAGSQELIQNAVIEHENKIRTLLQKMSADEAASLQKNGMKFHEVPNPEAYLKIAVDSAYERMTDRLKKAGRDTSHVSKLRSLFQE